MVYGWSMAYMIAPAVYHWSLVYPGILDKLLSLTINSVDWNKSLTSFVFRFAKPQITFCIFMLYSWQTTYANAALYGSYTLWHIMTTVTVSTWSPVAQLQSVVLHHLPTTQRSAKVVCVLVSNYSLTIFQLWIIPGSSFPCLFSYHFYILNIFFFGTAITIT